MRQVLVIASALVMVACSMGKSADRCGVAGKSVPCACPGGGQGAQICQPDGTFAACQCADGAGAGAVGDGAQPASAVKPAQRAAGGSAEVAGATATAAKPGAACDLAGTWTLTGKPEGNASCAGRELRADQWVVTRAGPDKWAVGKSESAPVQIASASTTGGACEVKLTALERMCPSCRPPEETREYTYTLTVDGDEIRGTLDLVVDPGGLTDEDRSCRQRYAVTGTRAPLAGQTRFDKKAAQQEFIKLYDEFLSDCGLPDGEPGSVVRARLVVGPDGSIKSLQFDGSEQDPAGNCPDKYREFIEDFASNLTGRDQVMEFALTIK